MAGELCKVDPVETCKTEVTKACIIYSVKYSISGIVFQDEVAVRNTCGEKVPFC